MKSLSNLFIYNLFNKSIKINKKKDVIYQIPNISKPLYWNFYILKPSWFNKVIYYLKTETIEVK